MPDESDNNISFEIMWRRYFSSDDPEERQKGLHMLIDASWQGDPAASYSLAELLLSGAVHVSSGSSEEKALALLCQSADTGYLPARSRLNRICENKYQQQMAQAQESGTVRSGELVDFNGDVIKIDRTGVMTPVDAELAFVNGRNVLTLSANVVLVNSEPLLDEERLMNAILAGMKEWAGSYRVFGNQQLDVRVCLTTEFRMFDSVIVVPVTDYCSDQIKTMSKLLGTKKKKEEITGLLEDKRSFAASGLKWSAYSRKYIYIQCDSGRFDDYAEIQAVAKHEFGHVLGLGDLYESAGDSLTGVAKGTYPELDGYYINKKFYNLVMCDHHGPVSNNDIEMVVLAFKENKAQLYQPSQYKGKISDALGKGN